MNDKSLRQGRFSDLLSDEGCPKPLYDQILQRCDGCVVVPTLGSILPNWLLIIPEQHSLNFRELEEISNFSVDQVVRDFLQSRSIPATSAIWFEHGPAKSGTVVGCGVDHAHLHVLIDAPFELEEFVHAAEIASGNQFDLSSLKIALQDIEPHSSYLLIGSGHHAYTTKNVEHVGSQFLRRIVAELVGQPDAWNYRTHPGLDNVAKTLHTFSTV